MNTPREFLLRRREAAIPKLEAITESVLANLEEPPQAQSPSTSLSRPMPWPQALWRELVLPARRIWAGLAVAWALILATQLGVLASAPKMSVAISTDAVPFRMTDWEQIQLMAQFNQPPPREEAIPPKPAVPGPRSERRNELEIS